MKIYIYLLGFLVLLCNCDSDHASRKDIEGTWDLGEIYANEYWGGPVTWKTPHGNKQVQFTADLKYYSKTTGDFVLIGTYKKVSDNEIEITWDKPANSTYPTFRLGFIIDDEGHLTLPTGTTEGVVEEKYRRIHLYKK